MDASRKSSDAQLQLNAPATRAALLWWPLVVLAAAALLVSLFPMQARAQEGRDARPTVVLVHGAFAESSSWNGVIDALQARGFVTIAVANPLRGVASDARYLNGVLDGTAGPVVLVGHSYGGEVISAAAAGSTQVKALVFVAAFAPEVGETAIGLSTRFPGGTLGSALAPPVALPDGNMDLYIRQDRLHEQFAADLPAAQARQMASTQRPITEAALNEPVAGAAWKSIPSWFIYGDADRNIPAAAQEFMAARAGSRRTIAIRGASHVVMMSHPREVADLIVEAAEASNARLTRLRNPPGSDGSNAK